jgi:Predicted membrane protein (DUF2243)
MAQYVFKLVSTDHYGDDELQHDLGRNLPRGDVAGDIHRRSEALECSIQAPAHPNAHKVYRGMIVGWGLFNLVEGLIDHQLLGIHYVRQAPNYTVYNLTFLAIAGIGFIVIGWLLLRAGRSLHAGNSFKS